MSLETKLTFISTKMGFGILHKQPQRVSKQFPAKKGSQRNTPGLNSFFLPAALSRKLQNMTTSPQLSLGKESTPKYGKNMFRIFSIQRFKLL